MKKLLIPLAASIVVAVTASVKAEDINVPAGETVTISTTPATQPSAVNVHGTLEVKGGATVYPATVNVGCAAGDNAKVTVSGSGTRLGCGREGTGTTACAFTLGSNGGSGMLEVDGGDTGVEWGGLGLWSMTIAADAVSTGDTIDFLTLKSGYARTSGMVNNNKKPARILFAGGGLRCGQGWGSKLTSSGDFVWESVNKSTILIDLSNYGNAVTIGDTGSLAVRGEGAVTLRCAWGDSGTGNGQITVCKAISWEGSNNLNINENLKLNLMCDDTLPYGTGKGSVTINNGNAYINSKDNHTQHVNSLYVKSGKYTGGGKLVFGAQDVNGELSGQLGDEIQPEKEGAGTLTIAGATMATGSVFTVKAGKLLVKKDLNVKKFVIEDGAKIEVDGAVLTITEDSECSKVECKNGGRVVFATSNAAESALLKYDVGGDTELKKTGAGKLMVYDPTALPLKISVAEGEVAFSKYGCTNTFYKWTIRATTNPNSTMKLGELGVFDDQNAWVKWSSPASAKSIDAMQRGGYYFSGGLNYGWFNQGFQYALDGVLYTGGRNVYVEFSGAAPVESDSTTWRVVGWRLPEGVNAMSAFDICAAPPGNWALGDQRSWILESSADGTTWTKVHEMAESDAQGTSNHGCWRSGGTFKDGANTPPKPYFLLRNYITPGVTPGRETFAAELGKDTKLNVSAAGDTVALNELTLSVDGGMTLTGAKIANAGTLAISGIASGSVPRKMEIACQFADCQGVGSLSGWQVKLEGKNRSYAINYDQANSKLVLERKGMVLIVK